MRRFLFLSVAMIAGAACTGPAKDTTTKAAAPLIPKDRFALESNVATGYALIASMMTNNDAASIVSLYATNAILVLPDSTVQGAPAIAAHWVSLAKAKSMESFERSSLQRSIIDDPTVADSGSYLMILRRTVKDSIVERGRYQALWRARAVAGSWVMLEDHVTPDAGKKKGAK